MWPMCSNLENNDLADNGICNVQFIVQFKLGLKHNFLMLWALQGPHEYVVCKSSQPLLKILIDVWSKNISNCISVTKLCNYGEKSHYCSLTLKSAYMQPWNFDTSEGLDAFIVNRKISWTMKVTNIKLKVVMFLVSQLTM